MDVTKRLIIGFVIACGASLIWLVLVYLPVCHWVWGGGWLAQMGLLDFAGGTVVHITAGVGGILGTFLAGVFCSPNLGIFSGYGFGGDNASISEHEERGYNL